MAMRVITYEERSFGVFDLPFPGGFYIPFHVLCRYGAIT